MPVPARHSLGWRKITSSPRNHQEKVAERKGKKKISLPGWTRETAFLPVKIIRVCVRFLWKNKEERKGRGKKRSENVRRGWRTGEKAVEYRLDSRKGLSTFSHDTICCRHLTDNASAGAKYVFQLYLFPLSFSLRRGLFAKLPDHRGIPRVCNCVRGCLSLELFLDWSQQCLLRRERVETTGWRRVRGRETTFPWKKGVKICRNFYTWDFYLSLFDFGIFSLFLYAMIKMIGKTL